MKKLLSLLVFSACAALVFSCQIDDIEDPSGVNPPFVDPEPTVREVDYGKTNLGDLAALQGIKLGAAFTYQEYNQNPQVAEILTREFKAVTFGNEMKHDAIVQASGVMRFETADRMVLWAQGAGTELFGHVLGWHSQQQKTYLNKLISQAGSGDTGAINPAAISGGIDFERFSVGASTQLLDTHEFTLVNGPSFVSVVDAPAHSGSRSLKMDNSDGHATQAWDVQVVTKAFPVTPGETYRIAWYARASRAADMQLDIRGDGEVQYRNSAWANFAKMTTEWTFQYLDYTVQSGTELSLGFYGATEAVTYYLDDIQIFPREAAGAGEPARKAIDEAFKSYVYGMVQHFDTYAWDVVNETFTESGAFRTQADTPDGFVWGEFYKNTRAWVDSAFSYATAAAAQYGKKPVLYINDYNLETSPAKRKALCDYAKGNPRVTGVASQMHLDLATPDLKAKIEASLKDLVATGKMVRISELDLKNNDETAQAEMIKYIFQKYLELVPLAQRGGITFWGINDKDSWVGEANHPLLWKGPRYEKKEAYKVLYLYLCELNGINPYKE